MENEIMNNEVIEEVSEEITAVDSKKGLVVAAIGVAALVGVIAYKKVIKPMIAKRKAKKEAKLIEAECEEVVDVNDSEEN